MLAKKREAKAKLEVARKMDKVPQAAAEISEVKINQNMSKYNVTLC